jgi:hypothetical protein
MMLKIFSSICLKKKNKKSHTNSTKRTKSLVKSWISLQEVIRSTGTMSNKAEIINSNHFLPSCVDISKKKKKNTMDQKSIKMCSTLYLIKKIKYIITDQIVEIFFFKRKISLPKLSYKNSELVLWF